MTSPLRVLLVDDVELARSKLRRALAAHPDVEIVGEAADGEAMLAAVRALRPQLMFLDIAMPEQDGFSALSELPPAERPLVIFLTAYAQHALEAFRVEAVDYLLKPVEAGLLAEALARVRRRLTEPGVVAPPSSLEARFAERLTVRTDSGLRVIEVAAIRWVEAIRNYLALHLSGESVIVRATLQGLLEQLDPARFVRVHRSAIVNLAEVHELRPIGNGDQKMRLRDGSEIAISRTYREELLRRLAR